MNLAADIWLYGMPYLLIKEYLRQDSFVDLANFLIGIYVLAFH